MDSRYRRKAVMRLSPLQGGLSLCLLLVGSLAWSSEPEVLPVTPIQPGPDSSILLVQQPAQPAQSSGAGDQQQAADRTAAASSVGQSRTNLGRLSRSRAPEMLGDLGGAARAPTRVGIPVIPGAPAAVPAPAASPGLIVLPGTRNFKIAENESPRPDDRVYLSCNFFDDVNGPLNRRLGADLRDIRVFSETFGLEKTFLDGAGSVGLRLPLNTYNADSSLTNLGQASTDVGDLSVILKYALYRDPEQDNYFTAGLAVTAPTGPGSFAGVGNTEKVHATTLQPFVGWLWNGGDWYFQGFSAIDVPTSADVTLLFNDVGVGYYLYRNPNPDSFLTAIAPTVEVHVNTPLNHRGRVTVDNPTGTSDVVDLTAGVNVELFDQARLAVGVVTPVTGPKPFDVEVMAQFRLRF
jgi:hypothetical protein